MKLSATQQQRLIGWFLVLTTVAVYAQVGRFEFVNYDDEWIISENPYLAGGLSARNVAWAFTDSKYDWWHPLTWLSHMLDIELFGMNPGMHHLTNVFLHLANTLLCFAVFRRMTGAVWQSGFVAAMFALHPLHVESVAWVTERKDVLSTLFWFLTMWAYCRYVERPGLARYGVMTLMFVLGLMSKPMLVTLPFVLLLLDYWPLARCSFETVNAGNGWKKFGRLVVEKVPLFLLAAASSVATVLGQQHVGGVTDQTTFPMSARLGNAVLSYGIYLRKTIWPSDLAVFYPFPTSLPAWKVIGVALFLIVVTAWSIWLGRRCRYLLVGWFWYVGTLLPVIGLVQVGDRAMADRFMYVPMIGVCVMLAWALPELLARWPHKEKTVALLTGTAIAGCLVLTWFQVQTWRNSIALWEHAIRVVPNNYAAHNNLGTALAIQGRIDDAMVHFEETLRINPRHAPGWTNRGLVLAKRGRLEEAVTCYAAALQADPRYVEAQFNMGAALLQLGNREESARHFSEVVRLKPYHAAAHVQLAGILASLGNVDGAITHYGEALRFKPGDADTHHALALALAGQDKIEEAIRHYQETVRLDPDRPKAHFNLGVALASRNRFAEAIAHYETALRLQPDYPEAHNNLGLALASSGRMDAAIAQFRCAIGIKPGYAKAHFNLALGLLQQGMTNEAEASFREAEEIDPSLGPEIQKHIEKTPPSRSN